MLTSFNLFEIVFRPMVNKGMARGVSAILQRAPGRFLSGRSKGWEDGPPEGNGKGI